MKQKALEPAPDSTATRCPWARDPLSIEYHDREWGVPVHDERKLFEFLILEGAQAGLSWDTILRKRENYRAAFADFDPEQVARFDRRRIERLMKDPGVVRSKAKLNAAVANATAFVKIRKEFGSFDSYIWGFVGGTPRRNSWKSLAEVPKSTPESIAMSKDLRKRGFKFTGPTICYAFMQAVGMVNDHLTGCLRHRDIK